MPDQPQAQEQTVQMVKTVQQDQSQPVMVNPVAQVPQVSEPMTVTPVAQVPQVSQMQLQQQAIPAHAPVQQLPVHTAATSTEPEFHSQCSIILLPGGGSRHQAPKIWKYHINYLIHIEINSYLLLKVTHYESNAT